MKTTMIPIIAIMIIITLIIHILITIKVVGVMEKF